MYYVFFVKREDGKYVPELTTDSNLHEEIPLKVIKLCGSEDSMSTLLEFMFEFVPNENGVFDNMRIVTLGLIKFNRCLEKLK